MLVNCDPLDDSYGILQHLGMGAFYKTACESCGQHIEFPAEMVGQSSACPTCGTRIELQATFAAPKGKRANNSKQYWVQNQQGAWGPFEWKILRDWFVSGWLAPETQVHECSGNAWVSAEAIPILWKVTESLRGRIRSFEARSLMSEKLPVSAAQAARLASLGWPGDASLLRNYYWANKLRESLEEMFPDSNRSAFDDPDWPWSGGCPAETEKWQLEIDAGPPTQNEEAVLRFFHGPRHHFTTREEAEQEIERLFANP